MDYINFSTAPGFLNTILNPSSHTYFPATPIGNRLHRSSIINILCCKMEKPNEIALVKSQWTLLIYLLWSLKGHND